MRPRVYRAHHLVAGQWVSGWAVHFQPTDPDTSSLAWRDTWQQALRLAIRIWYRQHREQQWAARAIEQCSR